MEPVIGTQEATPRYTNFCPGFITTITASGHSTLNSISFTHRAIARHQISFHQMFRRVSCGANEIRFRGNPRMSVVFYKLNAIVGR